MYQYWVYYRCTYTYLLHKKHITSLASCLAMRAFEATAARKEAAFHADEEHGRGSPENRCAGNIRKSLSEFETSGSYYWVIPLCTIPWLVYIYIYIVLLYIYVGSNLNTSSATRRLYCWAIAGWVKQFCGKKETHVSHEKYHYLWLVNGGSGSINPLWNTHYIKVYHYFGKYKLVNSHYTSW